MEACMSCPAHCCTAENKGEGVAFITLRDAERIVEATGKTVEEFAEVFEFESDEDVEQYLNSDAAGDRMFGELIYKRQLLSLKSKPHAKSCVFLRNNKLCSIYENRPMICRMFPLWFGKEKGKIVFTKHNNGSAKNEGCPELRKNPGVGKLLKLTGADRKTAAMAEQYYLELMEYKKYNKLLDEMEPDDVLRKLQRKSGNAFGR